MPQSPPHSPKTPQPVIVLTGGGSGGHITPLLSLAHELKKQNPNCQLAYIGFKQDKFTELKGKYHIFDEASFITAGKFRRYHGENWLIRLADVKTFLLNVRDIFRTAAGILQARRSLKKLRPDAIFLKGGFVGVPVGIAARLQKIPTVTHDSDAIAGLSNRIVGRWAVLNTTSMPADYYPYDPQKIRHIGIPVGPEVKPLTKTLQEQYKGVIGLKDNQQMLLIAGGGLGSRRINELIVAIAPKLLESNPHLVICHITGQRNQDSILSTYKKSLNEPALKRVKVLGFSDQFHIYSGGADLIVARAGATSVAEFALQGKACVLVPSPFLAAGHQLKNAQELEKLGAAVVLAETTSREALFNQVNSLLANPEKRHHLAEKLSQTARPHAAKQLAEILLDLARQHIRQVTDAEN